MKLNVLKTIIDYIIIVIGLLLSIIFNYFLVGWIDIPIQWLSRSLNLLFFCIFTPFFIAFVYWIFLKILQIKIVETFFGKNHRWLKY